MRHVTRGWWMGVALAGGLAAGSVASAQSMIDVTAAMGTQSAATATGGMSPVQTLDTVRRNLAKASAAHKSGWTDPGDFGAHGGASASKDSWARASSPGRVASVAGKGWATKASQNAGHAGPSTWARSGDATNRRR